MKTIQHPLNPNIRNHGSYSGKNRASKSPSSGFSSNPPEPPLYNSGSSFLENSSNSENNLAQQSSRSQQKLREFRFFPFFPQDNTYKNPGASGVGKTYPRDCRSIEIVPGWKEGGCGVTCVSMITGLSYKECRDVALSLGVFSPEGGMMLEGIVQTFQALGVNARLQPFRSLSEVPDLAVLGVSIGGMGHVVVFKRKNGRGYIFDRNAKVPLSPERFTLMDYQCIAIPER
jgi:hypothetical protein